MRTRLEDLLRVTVPVPAGCVAPEGTPMSPEFRVAVQEVAEDGVRIIVHALGHNSDTLDLWVIGDSLLTLDAMEQRRRLLPKTTGA